PKRLPKPRTTAYRVTVAWTTNRETLMISRGLSSRPRGLFPSRAVVVRGSVSETVDHVVDADLIGLVGFAHRTQPETRPLPELRDVGVVVDDHLQALGRIVVLEQSAEDRPAADAEDLRHDLEVVDLEERVEDGMGCVQIVEARVGHHPLHVRLEDAPAAAVRHAH